MATISTVLLGQKQKASSTSTATEIILYASNWTDKTQTIAVRNVDGDETKQLIQVAPANSSLTDWQKAGIYCSDQNEGELTFSTQTTPTSDLTAYVVITEFSAMTAAESMSF